MYIVRLLHCWGWGGQEFDKNVSAFSITAPPNFSCIVLPPHFSIFYYLACSIAQALRSGTYVLFRTYLDYVPVGFSFASGTQNLNLNDYALCLNDADGDDKRRTYGYGTVQKDLIEEAKAKHTAAPCTQLFHARSTIHPCNTARTPSTIFAPAIIAADSSLLILLAPHSSSLEKALQTQTICCSRGISYIQTRQHSIVVRVLHYCTVSYCTYIQRSATRISSIICHCYDAYCSFRVARRDTRECIGRRAATAIGSSILIISLV